MMFQNKLNHKNCVCVLWRNVDVSLRPVIRDARHQSFSASTQPSQTRHARPKRTDFLRENQTTTSATTISLNPPDRATTISRLITQSIVVRERCWKKWTLLMTFVFRQWIGKQFWPDIDPLCLWCSAGVVSGMPRAGLHYNLGTSRGPDKIGSQAGSGPRAVSCTWLSYTYNKFFRNREDKTQNNRPWIP